MSPEFDVTLWVIGILTSIGITWGIYVTRKLSAISNALMNANLAKVLHELAENNKLLGLILQNMHSDVKEVERKVEKVLDKI